jgi:hypothetical protein
LLSGDVGVIDGFLVARGHTLVKLAVGGLVLFEVRLVCLRYC